MGLIICEQCGYDLSADATHCPQCNTPVVLIKLTDSLTRKKKRNRFTPTNDKNNNQNTKLRNADKTDLKTNNTDKTSPNIFDTIKSFKEENKLSEKEDRDSEDQNTLISKTSNEKIAEINSTTDELNNINESLNSEEGTEINSTRNPSSSYSPKISDNLTSKKKVHNEFTANKDTGRNDYKGRGNNPNGSKYNLFLIFGLVILLALFGIYMVSRSDNPKSQEDLQREKSEHFNSNRQKIIDEINTQLSLNNYGNAQKLAREYLYINDEEINKMYLKARKEFLIIELSKLPSKWDNYQLPKYIPSDGTDINLFLDIKQNYKEKRRIYDELAKIEPANADIRDKYQYFSQKFNEIDTILEEFIKKKAEIKKKEEVINRQFSKYDGSHINLEEYIKSKMKHPYSYVHIKSTYQDRGNYLEVTTTYQGKDNYDQVSIKTVKARVDLINGKVLRIISEY